MKRATYTQPAADTAWARGCEHCKFGIVASVELTRACEFYLERTIQTLRDQIEFCSCRAGVAYKAHMMNQYRTLIEAARHNPLMQESARNGTHPDLESAAAKIDAIYAASMPTMRLEGDAP